MKSGNVVNKYTVCVKKDKVVVGHLPLVETGRFAIFKLIFYFFRAENYSNCNVITRREVIIGYDKGVQVPCLRKISRTKQIYIRYIYILDILKRKLCI